MKFIGNLSKVGSTLIYSNIYLYVYVNMYVFQSNNIKITLATYLKTNWINQKQLTLVVPAVID